MSTDSKIYLQLKTPSAKRRWLDIMKNKYKLNKLVIAWIEKEEELLKKYEKKR